MRNPILISTALLITASALTGGCFHVLECADDSTCPLGTSSSTGTGANPACMGDPNGRNVADDCGVFAQADAPPGGDGSMARPFAKLGDAVAMAESAGKRVYACTSAPFGE